MLKSLDWRSIEQRRVDSRLTTLYKIRNHLVAIDEDWYSQRGIGQQEHQYLADKDYTRFSFFPRTVIQWNQLPSQICLAESLDNCMDTGYQHDGCGDKNSYPHDGRADKDSYQHDGRVDKDSYPHDRHSQHIIMVIV